MFPEIRGGRSMDRITLLVIGYGHEKLPNVSDGTGGEVGPSCIDFVQEHHVSKRMNVLSLDTSVSNTGTWLPSILAPYAYEVFLTKIFQSSIGHNLGSELMISKISSISWTDLIITTAKLIHLAVSLQDLKNSTVLVVRRSLASGQQRNDYQ